MRAVLVLALASFSLALGAGGARGAPSTDGAGIGLQGPSFAGSGGLPSASTEESKLWWNDGGWWATLWDVASEDFHIFRLDRTAGRWRDTGVAVDDRSRTRSDALWDGRHLYIVSHKFSGISEPKYGARLYRFRYERNTHTYSLDSGFPVLLTDYAPETLVLDKDSSGQLWATWVRGGAVYVNRSTCSPRCDDSAWGKPFVLPVAGAQAADGDVAALVAFGRDVGVLWSNQRTGAFYFAVHPDEAPDETWEPSTTLPGASANDHLSLKAGPGGRVFAAVKTGSGRSSDPGVVLFARDPATGAWRGSVVGQRSDEHTRPVVLVDREHDAVHVFATAPSPSGAGTIYEKVAPEETLYFDQGVGLPAIHLPSSDVNDATSTKQMLDSVTGLVVVASDRVSERYLYSDEPLTAPAAEPERSPLEPPVPGEGSGGASPPVFLLLALTFVGSIAFSAVVVHFRRGRRPLPAGEGADIQPAADAIPSPGPPPPSPLDVPRGLLASAAAPSAVLAVGLWLLWAWLEGGFSPADWGIVGIALTVLFAISLGATAPRMAKPRRSRTVMLLALVAFVGWNFLSITWADFRADAWVGSDKTLLYAVGFALFALWPWTGRDRLIVLGLFALGTAVVAAVVLARAALVANPQAFFDEGRLIAPTGYMNATAALWMLGLWPALHLAARRETPWRLRALFLAAAALLIEVAVLGQSRGWLFLLPLAAAVWLALARERLRAVIALVVVGVATLSVLRPLLDVYTRAGHTASLESLLDRAARLVFVSCAVVALAGAAWAWVDGRVAPSLAARRLFVAGIALVCVAALAFGGVRVATSVHDPGRWVSERWRDFTSGAPPGRQGSTRFTDSLRSNRAQEWKVAWIEFTKHPIVGLGADNYQAEYLQRRTSSRQEPLYPHSTELRLLSQLGVVGTALFAVAAGIAVLLALRRRRSEDREAAGAAAAALMVFVYWLLHSSVDVLWEIPALAAPAFGMLGLAAAPAVGETPPLAAGNAPRDGQRRARVLRLVPPAFVALLTLAACTALALPWLSFSYQQAGAAVWRQRPTLAYDRLELAADLEPVAAEPLVIEGSIALRRRDLDRARDSLLRALQRESRNWYANFQLAMVAAVQRDYREAELWIDRAKALNPEDPIVEIASRLIRVRTTIDPEFLNRLYRDQLNRFSLHFLLNRFFAGSQAAG